jgi:PPOX class probable F420-dependent enzyme
MPKPPLPDDVQALLARPNPSVITTLRPDGAPVSVATWYLWENGRVLVNMDEGRKRLDYLRQDPRTTITVLADDDWYTHVSMQGRVVQWDDDTDLTQIDRLSKHYTGKPYPVRDRKRVGAWIEVERWHGWGAAEATETPQSSG